MLKNHWLECYQIHTMAKQPKNFFPHSDPMPLVVNDEELRTKSLISFFFEDSTI